MNISVNIGLRKTMKTKGIILPTMIYATETWSGKYDSMKTCKGTTVMPKWNEVAMMCMTALY